MHLDINTRASSDFFKHNFIVYCLSKWLIYIVIYLSLYHPIRKLLVLINQSFYFIYFCYSFFDRANKKQIYMKWNWGDMFAELIWYWLSFLVLFSTKITVSFKKAALLMVKNLLEILTKREIQAFYNSL